MSMQDVINVQSHRGYYGRVAAVAGSGFLRGRGTEVRHRHTESHDALKSEKITNLVKIKNLYYVT